MKNRLIVCALLVGCGGGGGGDVPVGQLGAELGQHMCARLFECCDAQEIMDELGFFNVTTEGQCVTFYTGFVGSLLTPQVEAAVAAGRMNYHGDRMGDCLGVLGSMSCSDFGAAYGADTPWGGCADPFEGLVANGSACANDIECMSDYCEGEETDQNGNVAVEGTCLAFPSVGNECPDFDCAEGAYCTFDGSASTCAATAAAGSDCDEDDACASGNCDGADPINNVVGTCSASSTCDGL